MRRLFLCLCVAAGAGVVDYTTTPPRVAKREAVEKAAESARGVDTATADGGVEPVLENDVSLRDQDLTRRFDIAVAHDVDAARRRLGPVVDVAGDAARAPEGTEQLSGVKPPRLDSPLPCELLTLCVSDSSLS